ncbi:MAG: ATP-binding protein [Dechloromonas sp.]|nr:ATP-binding protein [Dechloromonas sp.]
MPFIFRSIGDADHRLHLRRLIVARWLMLLSMTLLILWAPVGLDLPLPHLPMLGILAIAAILNAIAQQRLHTSHPQAGELSSQLLLDIGALGGLVFFSGGATNPLVSLLLPPVAIAAIALPARHVLLVGSAAILTYSLLMLFYVPLSIADATRATRLHLIGMWLTFVVSAGLIGWIILRMTQLIRQRDAELASTRETALRDERVLAMGTLAAGAAHELGTPLATMHLIVGELARDPTLAAAVQDDMAVLRQQLGICKEIISGLARRAGAERLEKSNSQAVDRWLEQLRQHWHAARPQAASLLHVLSTAPAPEIIIDPRLEQAVLNLLNNAANASPCPVDISLSWSGQQFSIAIGDAGPGFPPSVLDLGGHTDFPAHAGGSGVGLLLTRSAIEQLGGRLLLSNPEHGGALACLEIPLEQQP